MLKTFLTFIAAICILSAKAQKTDVVTINDGDSTYAEVLPQFPGGLQALFNYLGSNIHYPANAVKNHIQGRVIVSVAIETDGSITNAKVVHSVSEELDKEALRVINQSPKWIPAKRNGKPTRTEYSIPIKFAL